MASNATIIQWNACGLKHKLPLLNKLINEFLPIVINVQETKFNPIFIPSVNNYKSFCKNCQNNSTPHGGVAIFVRNDVSADEFNIITNFQAIAVKIKLNVDIVVCNLYLPGSTSFSKGELVNLLGLNFLIVGDFNAHNPLWGSKSIDHRGKIIEEIIDDNEISLLNENQPTFLSNSYGTFSNIDLAFSSTNLGLSFEWNVSENSYTSDHFPVILSYDKFRQNPVI